MKPLSLRTLVIASSLPLLLTATCSEGDSNDTQSTAGTSGSGASGSAGSAGASGSATAGSAGSSGSATAGSSGSGTSGTGGEAGASSSSIGLPVPPGPGDMPRPSGSTANLRVLPWAGFSAAISYTLDDSQPSQIAHWQDLKAEGIRMTFYINSANNYIANYDATWKDALAQGNEIANHTVHHCHAGEITDTSATTCPNALASIDAEIDECTSYIETKIGDSDVYTFAYPFGDTGYKAGAQSRFFIARGVGSGTIGPNDATDPFNLPIYGAAGGEATSVFTGQIDNVVTQGRWLIYLFHSLLPGDNWYAGVDIANVTGSIDYAKGLGTVWLDSVVNVGAYWLGQRALQASAPVTSGTDTTWTWTLPAHFPPGHVLRVAVDGGTLTQGGGPLSWDGHGYYEISLDAGSLTWSP